MALYEKIETGEIFKIVLGGVERVENGVHYRGSARIVVENVETGKQVDMATKKFMQNFKEV